MIFCRRAASKWRRRFGGNVALDQLRPNGERQDRFHGAWRLDAHSPVRMIDENPYAWFEKELAAIYIGPNSAVPEYHAGDRMDWDLSVAAIV